MADPPRARTAVPAPLDAGVVPRIHDYGTGYLSPGTCATSGTSAGELDRSSVTNLDADHRAGGDRRVHGQPRSIRWGWRPWRKAWRPPSCGTAWRGLGCELGAGLLFSPGGPGRRGSLRRFRSRPPGAEPVFGVGRRGRLCPGVRWPVRRSGGRSCSRPCPRSVRDAGLLRVGVDHLPVDDADADVADRLVEGRRGRLVAGRCDRPGCASAGWPQLWCGSSIPAARQAGPREARAVVALGIRAAGLVGLPDLVMGGVDGALRGGAGRRRGARRGGSPLAAMARRGAGRQREGQGGGGAGQGARAEAAERTLRRGSGGPRRAGWGGWTRWGWLSFRRRPRRSAGTRSTPAGGPGVPGGPLTGRSH